MYQNDFEIPEQEIYGDDAVKDIIDRFNKSIEEREAQAKISDTRLQRLLNDPEGFKREREKSRYDQLIKSNFGFTPNTKAKKVAGKAAEIGSTLLGMAGLPIFGVGHSRQARKQSEEDYAQALKAAQEDQRTNAAEFRASQSPQVQFINKINELKARERKENMEAGFKYRKLDQGDRALDLSEQKIKAQIDAQKYNNAYKEAKTLIDQAKLKSVEAKAGLDTMRFELAQEIGVDPEMLKDEEALASLIGMKKLKIPIDIDAYRALLDKGKQGAYRYTRVMDGPPEAVYNKDTGDITMRSRHKIIAIPSGRTQAPGGMYTPEGGFQQGQPKSQVPLTQRQRQIRQELDQQEMTSTMAGSPSFSVNLDKGNDNEVVIGNNPKDVEDFRLTKSSKESLDRAAGAAMMALNSGDLNQFKGLLNSWLEDFRAATGSTTNAEVINKLNSSIASMKHLFAMAPKANPAQKLIDSITGAVSNKNDTPAVFAARMFNQKISMEAIMGLKLKDPRILEIQKNNLWDKFYEAVDQEISIAVNQGANHASGRKKSDGKTFSPAVVPDLDRILRRMKEMEKGKRVRGTPADFDRDFGVR